MKPTEYITLRKTIGTQGDVAGLLSISRRTLCKLESGAREITAEDEAALRELLPGEPMPVGWLLRGISG